MPRVKMLESEDASGVQTVQLVLGILEYLAKQEVAGVTEIASALGSTKARTHRHLRTLVNMGYCLQELTGERYCAGPRLIVLAQTLASENTLVRVSRPILRRLRDALGHTTTLAKVDGRRASMVDVVPGQGPVNISVAIGLDLSLHASATGKLVLAFGERSDRIDNKPPRPFTEHTLVDPQALQKDIEQVRDQGWASAPEEYILGINTVTAPIFDRGNHLIGAVGFVDSVQFLPRVPSLEQISKLMAAAAEITRHYALEAH